MTASALLQATVNTGPQMARTLLAKLLPHAEKFFSVVEKAPNLASVTTTTAADGGVAKVIFNTRQLFDELGILPDLESLSVSLNSQATEVQKKLFSHISAAIKVQNGEITVEQGRDLLNTLGEIGFPSTTGTSASSSSKTTESQEEDSKQGSLDEKMLDTDPFGYLTGNITKILRRELINKSSWLGLAAEIADKTGLGSLKDIEGFINNKLLTPEFKDALKKSILGQTIDAKFEGLQGKSFKVLSWSLWTIDKMPVWSIQYIPLVTTILKFAMPIWTHIPYINKILGTAYPVIDEVSQFFGKFVQETEASKKAMAKIKEQAK